MGLGGVTLKELPDLSQAHLVLSAVEHRAAALASAAAGAAIGLVGVPANFSSAYSVVSALEAAEHVGVVGGIGVFEVQLEAMESTNGRRQ